MDASKYIKKCPRCGTEIELDRYTTVEYKVTIISIENDYDKKDCSSTNAPIPNMDSNGKREYIPTMI